MASRGGGCGLLLLLALVAMLLPLLTYLFAFLLGAGLLVAAAALLLRALSEHGRLRLRRFAANAEQRFAGDICRTEAGYGQLQSIAVAPARLASPGLRLTLRLRLLEPSEQAGPQGPQPLQLRERQRELIVPTGQLEQLASTGEFGRFLRSQGITMVSELSVEARATRAALECLQERNWAESAQARLSELVRSTLATLAKADGNELLEPAIPQLQHALGSFLAEQDKLGCHRQDCELMLRKLHDFLSVPEQIQPILNFDLDALFTPSRLRDLRASFEEVVILNDSYRALSRERIV